MEPTGELMRVHLNDWSIFQIILKMYMTNKFKLIINKGKLDDNGHYMKPIIFFVFMCLNFKVI